MDEEKDEEDGLFLSASEKRHQKIDSVVVEEEGEDNSMRTIATPRCRVVASECLQGKPIKVSRLLKASSAVPTIKKAAVYVSPPSSSPARKVVKQPSSSSISTRRNTSSQQASQTSSAAAPTINPRLTIVKQTGDGDVLPRPAQNQ